MATLNNPFSQQPSMPQVPNCVLQRAKGLKMVLIVELIFCMIALFTTSSLLPILILVPANIVGFYGAHHLRARLLTLFVYMKTLVITVMSLYIGFGIADLSSCEFYCDYFRQSYAVFFSVLALMIVAQILCIVIANRIRYALLAAATSPSETVELGHLGTQEAAASQSQTPVYPYPYPMAYVPQHPQGYAGMPYAYPEYPVNGQQGQPPMHAVYPTYMYPDAQQQQQQFQQQQQQYQQQLQQFQQAQQQQPTYTFTTEGATPVNKDTEALI